MKQITTSIKNPTEYLFIGKGESINVYGNGAISVYGHGTVNVHDEVVVFDNDCYGDFNPDDPENWWGVNCTLTINAYDSVVVYPNGSCINLHDNAEIR